MTSFSATIQFLVKERRLSLSSLADKMGVNCKTLYSCVHGNLGFPVCETLQTR